MSRLPNCIQPTLIALIAVALLAPAAHAGWHVNGIQASSLALDQFDIRAIPDGAGGAIVNCVGYGRPEIAEAAAEGLRDHAYALPTMNTPARQSLAERLMDNWLPTGLTRCLFVSGGSESVDTAMRVARQHHVARGNDQKWKILGREISYHGSTLATLSVANHDRRRAPFGELLLDMAKIVEQTAIDPLE